LQSNYVYKAILAFKMQAQIIEREAEAKNSTIQMHSSRDR